MEFRLVYDGPLSSSANNSRLKEKHNIRRAIHSQLREFRDIRKSVKNVQYIRSSLHELRGYKFQPIVTSDHACYCDLDILFLRYGKPGSILVRGDTDNRLKTLYDALRVPQNESELPSNVKPEGDEKETLYCLLEDDSLITASNVTTDRLLIPPVTGNEVKLIIHVHIEPMVRSADNLGF